LSPAQAVARVLVDGFPMFFQVHGLGGISQRNSTTLGDAETAATCLYSNRSALPFPAK
jgi:hypothetical protein